MKAWRDHLVLWFYRLACSGLIPARWFLPQVPRDLPARTGRLHLEVVSHCWNYAHLQAFQLSSVVLHPPTKLDLTMTVFYCAEDELTVSCLDFFAGQEVPGVHWNWQPLPRAELFRRAIGRERAARATKADWIWFTDCDLVFDAGSLDALASVLQGLNAPLVYPAVERVSSLLTDDHPLLRKGDDLRLKPLDASEFMENRPSRATGPLQIAHGDIARACGYCGQLGYFMQPVERWAKTYEDRAFRWLIRSQGQPIDVPGVCRIRHVSKGRYHGQNWWTRTRSRIRRVKSRLNEIRQGH